MTKNVRFTMLFVDDFEVNLTITTEENVRDITAGADIPMTTGHYLRSMKQLTNQWTPQNFRDERRQRLYLKDIDCPDEWQDALQRVLHPSLFYLNENVAAPLSPDTAEMDSAGTRRDRELYPGGRPAAPAGDLMSSLPEEMRAENLMCYIGHEGTYTPAHREMCASVGHNIMVEASDDSFGEKSGSSIWFMTESKDRDVVREYFLSMLGHDIEIEKHFAQINAWKKAPFDVYLVEQRAGDFIIIPPLAAHQVWNRGTRTMKVAWNRITPETLRLALREALPKARLVCRDEQYKNKAIIYFTLQKYYQLLKDIERQEDMNQTSFMGIGRDIVRNSPRTRQLAGDFKSLFNLFTEILVEEAFAYKEKQVESLAFDSCVTCSYCRSNIFNRFLTCKHCTRILASGDEDAYDVCMECYAMGRSCACVSGLQWCEQWSWAQLSEKYELWREMIIINDGFVDLQRSPPPFEAARQKSARKSVAQICQEALIRRPWKDITKQDYGKAPSDSDPGDIEDGPKKKPKRKKKQGQVRRCHVCCHKDYSYRVHECSNPECAEAYCYGVLYRAFDMMPQSVLQDENWQCPKCLGICNCGYCRRAGNTNPYTPKNTSLGHDTRPVADDRSIEALVDFRVHNLSWLKAAGEESRSKNSRRMQKLRQQADHAKARSTLSRSEDEAALLGRGECYQSSVAADTEHQELEAQDIHDYSALPTKYEGDAHASTGVEQQEDLAVVASTTQDGRSNYPDPSMASSYGIGMGYYEQDDTPDKILFDPYKAPPVGTIHMADLDVPDSVKKTIRAAKRKARRENEDPDFVIGKSNYKKVRRASGSDMLDNMDPALFDVASSTSSTLPQKRQGSKTFQYDSLDAVNKFPGAAVTENSQEPMFNEPALRHARPLASYVEVDDADMEVDISGMNNEEPKDEISTDDRIADPSEEHQISEDQSDNGGNVQSNGLGHELSATSKKLKPTYSGKRRGRPRKPLSQPSSRIQQARPTTETAPPIHTPASQRGRGRGRGRPRKSLVVSLRQPDLPVDAEMATLQEWDRSPKQPSGILNRIRHGNRQSGTGPPTTSTAQQYEGRSPARGITKNMVSQELRTQDLGSDKRAKIRSSAKDHNLQSDTNVVLHPRNSTSVNQPFMSMAERLALKGKRFKIGKRRTATSTSRKDGDAEFDPRETPIPAVWSQSQSKSPSVCHEASNRSDTPQDLQSSSSSPSSQMANQHELISKPSATGQKTIVRLTDVVSSGDEDAGSDNLDPMVSSSDESGDGDIPADRAAMRQNASSRISSLALNHGRGRGRGRGRPRGRPRGRLSGPGRNHRQAT